jgi:hypothetical protein
MLVGSVSQQKKRRKECNRQGIIIQIKIIEQKINQI